MASSAGTDITADYAQMVDEDILHGHVDGETLDTFLPVDLAEYLPKEGPEAIRMQALRRAVGEQAARQRLIQHFFALGQSGERRAKTAWKTIGLDYDRRGDLALALQNLLAQADRWMLEQDVGVNHGRFLITETECTLDMDGQPLWRGLY